MQSLPTELIARVFLQLAVPKPAQQALRDRKAKRAYKEARTSLLTCALVCRRWRDIAQSIIFQDLRFTLHDRTLRDIHDFFTHSPHLSSSTLSLHLERLSKKQRPAFAGVRSVSPPTEAVLDADCGDSIVLLIDTLRLFPNALAITLEDILYPHAQPAELLCIKNASLKVDTLEVDLTYRAAQDCSRELADILACFESVSRLRITGVPSSLIDPSFALERVLRFPQVKTLELDNSFCQRHVLSTLQMPSHGARYLQRLDITHIDSTWRDVLPALQSLLGTVGHQLTHLRCNVANFSYITPADSLSYLQPLDLSACTSLQSLTLGFQLSDSRRSSPGVWARVLGTLELLDRQPSPPPLKTLVLEAQFFETMDLDIDEHMMAIGIHNSEALLLHICQQFGLRGIVFSSPMYPYILLSSAYRASLSSSFPALQAAGKLHYLERTFLPAGRTEVI